MEVMINKSSLTKNRRVTSYCLCGGFDWRQSWSTPSCAYCVGGKEEKRVGMDAEELEGEGRGGEERNKSTQLPVRVSHR